MYSHAILVGITDAHYALWLGNGWRKSQSKVSHSAAQIEFYARMKHETVAVFACYSHHVYAESALIHALEMS